MHLQPIDPSLSLIAIQAALQAGKLLRNAFGSKFDIATKTNSQDLVTQFDKAAESTIIDLIKSHFPKHTFLGEESGHSDENIGPVHWIIDPLDGTMNFAHEIPLFTVSIAALVDNQVIIGIVYDPMRNELFAAQKGVGAFLNGTPISVSNRQDMLTSVGATLFPYGEGDLRHRAIEQFVKFLHVGNPIRIIGSAAMALAYVAAGRFDAFWGVKLKPWDIAAGKLLIEEAGGMLTNYDGTPHNLTNYDGIVASNSLLHQEILSCLK